jgi:uncharacterized protein YjbJ (UPF0337 family)
MVVDRAVLGRRQRLDRFSVPILPGPQQAQGRLKRAIGGLTGNRRQARQGRADQARGRLRERWGHLKDALHR